MAAVAIAGYALLLVVLGYLLDGCARDMVEERLETALDAEVEVGEVSLSLLRGHIEVEDIEIERSQYGKMKVTIDHISVDTAGFGWVAIDRDPDFVEVSGVEMSMSGAGALRLPDRPKRKPLDIGGMRLRDIEITAQAISFIPGMGEIQLKVAEARTGPVVLASALDWVFALQKLDASTKLPAGVTAGVHYVPGELGLSGSIFGSRPVMMPFTIPTPDADMLEMDKLRLLSDALLKTVGKKLAKSWLKSKVTNGIKDLLD